LFIRFFMWIPRTPFGRLASILAGLAIAAILWFGLFGEPSFTAPRGTEAYFRDEEAFVITIIATLAGGSWIGTLLEIWRLSHARRSAFERDFKESADRLIAEAATRGQEADAVRHSAWFADNVVDLVAARRRVGLDGHFVGLGFSFLDMPNPYFVLPAEAIVKWGFASASQVESAYMMAANGTAPATWRDPALMRDLGYMGWGGTESVARIGLFLESLDRPNRTKPD
jgi:hypothetical protein